MQPTLQHFLTDAALPRLCDELTRVTAVPIWTEDAHGRAIIPSDGKPAWREASIDEAAARAAALISRPPPNLAALFRAPLRLSIGPIGQIAMPADWHADDPARRRALERTVTLLASASCEWCEGQMTLRQRVRELEAMYRLSSMQVREDDADRILAVALDLALSIVSADAGTISVLEPDAATLTHRAARGLSHDWLADSSPLSVRGSIRRSALAGEVVCVEDLRADPLIDDHSRPAREGLCSLVAVGLMYQGRPIGLMRLYSRSPRSFSPQEQGLLRSVAEHSAAALAHSRLKKLRAEDERVQRQVRLAAEVQRRMLPRRTPDIPPFDLAARYSPSFDLGGDFYDLFETRSQLALVVGDVVGKGVPAALLMAAVRASLRAHIQTARDIDEALARVNAAVARDTLESEFATLWLALADPRSLRLTYCSAGHDPPLVARVPHTRPPARADVDELAAGGMAIGIDPSQRYQLGSFDLRPNDVLIAYTDGLTDAMNFAGERFGRARLIDSLLAALTRAPGATASEILAHVSWDLRQFAGLANRIDDITLVVLRVRDSAIPTDPAAAI